MVSPYSAARHTTPAAALVRYFASEEDWCGRAETYSDEVVT
jgi:hypothetical protein